MKPIYYLAAMLIVAILAPIDDAQAACTTQTAVANDTHILYTGSCTSDNEDIIDTGLIVYYDACYLMSTTGAVDVFVSLSGTYSTSALSLIDNGATDTSPVLVTTALRVYSFPAKFRGIKVKQNGATAAAASLLCWRYN